MIRIYRVNTGSCGGCDAEIAAAVFSDAGLAWADSPFDADALLLTGPVTAACRDVLLRLLREVGAVPVLAIGRCAIDGHPFGKGGVQEVSQITVRLKLEGCPPAPKEIAAAVRKALSAQESGDGTTQHTGGIQG